MNIYIKNFGTINEAQVCIGGLTVIAGENDTGKSTVGKILFSLVKAFSKIEDDLVEDRNTRIMSSLEFIYFSIRRSIALSSASDIRQLFLPPRFMEQIHVYGDEAIYERTTHIKQLYETKQIDNDLYESIKERLDSVKTVFNEHKDPKKAILGAVRKAFYSEFRGEIVNKLSNGNAEIQIKDGATLLLSMEWSKQELIKMELNDDISFDDSTYFESAVVLQFHQFIQNARTLFDMANSRNSGMMVPLHIKDLSRKLQDSMYTIGLESYLAPETLENIYGGKFYFDSDAHQFMLERNGYKYSSSNVASGIKNLGVFDILVNGGHLNSKTLTIIDEPEVNLHPDWQVKYAKLIVELVKSGANIIVTTHSPYIVESLYTYAEKMQLLPSFYLTEKDETGAKFIDVTRNLTKVIEKLSRPLELLHMEMDDGF